MSSWSVPKGPTLDPKLKRLAMQTTDHDVGYKDFEGVIPAGDYGAGAVMIWDEGTYVPEREVGKGIREKVTGVEGRRVMEEGLKKGEMKFELQGKKLHGSFALVKTHGFGPKNAWLLIKHNDAYVKTGYDAHEHDVSVRSGRTIKAIAEEGV